LSYYDNVNVALLNKIPAGARVVVEIGCGAGRLGMEYKKRNPDCRYYGVELVGSVAALAAERLDMVFCGAAEAVDLSFLAGKVDCFVYGDVLEHLTEPWALLKSHAALLSEGGKVAACIPNVQCWMVLSQILAGQWTYTESGLLDRTHLRFFTLASILDLFHGCGLRIEDLSGLSADQANGMRFIEQVRPALAGLGVDEEVFARQALVSQYIVVAGRAQP
jgi:trans-aconitate methyltransferase